MKVKWFEENHLGDIYSMEKNLKENLKGQSDSLVDSEHWAGNSGQWPSNVKKKICVIAKVFSSQKCQWHNFSLHFFLA